MARKRPQPPAHRLPLFLLSFFIILFCIGVFVDEPSRVLEQSWQICLSCIGIG
ncbi:MAG: hypothetical protein RI601_04050 [Desulfurivibrionaceae bacterium]|nr:hypothetical protein [Desulfurivibrionaceae bacterium]